MDAVVLNRNVDVPNSDTRSITQELHLSGGERFRWIVGAFYLDIDQNGFGNESWGPWFGYVNQWSRSNSKISSLSGFGQFVYDLSDSWRLVA